MSWSAALTTPTHLALAEHLLQHERDEDVCFALYRPSEGAARFTGLVFEPLLPREGERRVHGNASVTSGYFLRAASEAADSGAGLAFLHSHPRASSGWQPMSDDDIDTESAYAPRAHARTKLPLLGMTLAGDERWSARFWPRIGRGRYARESCENVRVVGQQLRVTYDDVQRPPPSFREIQKRTISSWGDELQTDLARLRVGVVGAGSVGAIVAEALARTGIERIRLIDFDSIKLHNLDRLMHASERDVRFARSKVESLAIGISSSATAACPDIEPLEHSVVEEDGYRAALDCDVLFSCVDRPWPRFALNLIAYAHLIPVIDGGIKVTVKDGRLRSADWKAHMVAPTRRCLECLGQYSPSYVGLDRQGDLDDPRYLEGIPRDHSLRANENVFGFSLAVAALEVLHLLRAVVAPGGRSDIGSQHHNLKRGCIDLDVRDCESNCWFSGPYLAMGDQVPISAVGQHEVAETERANRDAVKRQWRIRVARRVDRFARAVARAKLLDPTR